MNKRMIYSLAVAGVSLVICTGIVMAATYDITSLLGGTDGDFFDVQGTMLFDSIKVGRQGEGGVTFFNGTIINNTTGEGEADMPVTFGDNVRIDGRVFRGATAGTADSMPFIVNDNMEVLGSLTIGSLTNTDLITTGNILDATITEVDLANNSVTTNQITDATIDTADLAGDSVTSAKITDGTIATVDLADDSVTPDKIGGTGGANLPIAYGFVDSDGTLIGGTSNVTTTWDTNHYEITIDGEDYYYTEYIAQVTPVTEYISSVSSLSDNLTVYFNTHAGVAGQQSDFGFVVYKY
ncbi:hypothetical protein KKI23_00510 [Patescibacteria group bacterium]|nr:hypothetical protein [Patescibacteria group bacterium]